MYLSDRTRWAVPGLRVLGDLRINIPREDGFREDRFVIFCDGRGTRMCMLLSYVPSDVTLP